VFDLKETATMIDAALDGYLAPADTFPREIHEAVRYSVFAGGKRLRPLLTLTTADIFGAPEQIVMPPACAIELVHTYSLIHDDLPALDDDDFRRGRPSNHKVFGEAMAILAGDALLTRAFELLSVEGAEVLPSDTIVRLVAELGRAAGTAGMIGGQIVDIQSEGQSPVAEILEYIHRHKTGALFTCCIRSGAIVGGANDHEIERLTTFAGHIGLAFQIVDDILDVIGDETKLGKKTGSDESKHKMTYPALFGMEEAKIKADTCLQAAREEVRMFGKRADKLLWLTQKLVEREN
jgi:geranylgeranyl diphosphate synthase type II